MMRRAEVVVRLVFGAVLVCSAFFKMSASPPAWFCIAVPSPASTWVFVVLLELLIGLLLLLGIFQRTAVLFAFLLFTLFACIATGLALVGEASCGCLGRIPLRPWSAAILDTVAAAALLCVYAPTTKRISNIELGTDATEPPRGLFSCHLRSSVIAAVAVLVIALAWNRSWFGDAWLKLVPGADRLLVRETTGMVTGAVGETKTFLIAIRNLEEEPVSIIGVEPPCLVHFVDELPLTIPGQEQRELHGSIKLMHDVGLFVVSVRLYTSSTTQPVIFALVTGRVWPE